MLGRFFNATSVELCIIILLIIALPGVDCFSRPLLEVNLRNVSSTVGIKVFGAALSAYSGYSVSDAGDVNGDGIGDVIIGSPLENPEPGRDGAGVTYVIFGRNTTTPAANQLGNLDLSLFVGGTGDGFRVFGAEAGDNSGISVSGAGDFNGDGVDDIIIGAGSADPAGTRTSGGAAYIIMGRKTTSTNIDLASLAANPTLGMVVMGALANNFFGNSVSGAGDVNGDGYADVVIGAYLASSNDTRTSCGKAYVVFGRAGTFFSSLDFFSAITGPTVGFRIFGANAGDYLGMAVHRAGDINGDGVSDLLVGASQAKPFGRSPTAGQTYVIFGRRTVVENVDLPLWRTSRDVGFRVFGAAVMDSSSASLGALGDFNGDGIDDFVMSAYTATYLDRGASGTVYVIFGRNVTAPGLAFQDLDLLSWVTSGSLGFRIQGAAAVDRNGQFVSGAGDVNGDGIPDLITGAPNADPLGDRTSGGVSYVMFGRKVTPGSDFTDIDLGNFSLSMGFRIIGAEMGDMSGSAVSGAGDVNGDGVDDVIIGAQGAESLGRAGAGCSYVVFGARAGPAVLPAPPSAYPTSQPSSQPSSRPSRQPTSHPSSQPTVRPSTQPTTQPSRLPSTQPSCRPTGVPSSQPTSRPSVQPSSTPSAQPSGQPTRHPTGKPSAQPSAQPSTQPSDQPTRQPSARPSVQPSTMPTTQPSCQPSSQPSFRPSSQPSAQPSSRPSGLPTSTPSSQPSIQPSVRPSTRPSSRPSGQPSEKPSSRPSVQPTAVPSTQPSCAPSTQPFSRPTGQPSSFPSSQPSSVPSVQPSSFPSTQPIGVPSSQPSSQPSSPPSSQPSGQPSISPSTQPTGQPSSQPSAQPSIQPCAVPTTQPSSVPSHQPTSQPTRQPTSQPSSQPSFTPTSQPTLSGEWTSTVPVTTAPLLSTLMATEGTVWACGSSCVLLEATTGTAISRRFFPWSVINAVFETTDASSTIVLTASTASGGGSVVATCPQFLSADNSATLLCTAQSFSNAAFYDSTYAPFPAKIVSVGRYTSSYAVLSLLATGSSAVVQSYLYSAAAMRALTLSQVRSPPSFVGCFVAGSCVANSQAAFRYVLVGWARADNGNMQAMYLSPSIAGSTIVNSADLVTGLALETTGPDSFVVGGMELTDNSGVHAYLLRANALYNTVQYCVRYRSNISSDGGRRRALLESVPSHSVARGVVLVDTFAYLIVDHTHVTNTTGLSVLNTSAATGAIAQQAHLSAPFNASLRCTDIASSGLFLHIVCTVQYSSGYLESQVLTVGRNLSFRVLPAGFTVHRHPLMYAEEVPFRRTALTLVKQATTLPVITTPVESVADLATSKPTTNPSVQPSVLLTVAPSAQPSSSPTAAPSVSARPTSQPSSAVPTITHRPSAAPTAHPTLAPTVAATARPSVSPSAASTARPTVSPSKAPSAVPSVSPTAAHTRSPSASPTRHSSARPTAGPSAIVTTAPTDSSNAGDSRIQQSDNESVVIAVAAGGGALLIAFTCFLLYRRMRHKTEKAKRTHQMWKELERKNSADINNIGVRGAYMDGPYSSEHGVSSVHSLVSGSVSSSSVDSDESGQHSEYRERSVSSQGSVNSGASSLHRAHQHEAQTRSSKYKSASDSDRDSSSHSHNSSEDSDQSNYASDSDTNSEHERSSNSDNSFSASSRSGFSELLREWEAEKR